MHAFVSICLCNAVLSSLQEKVLNCNNFRIQLHLWRWGPKSDHTLSKFSIRIHELTPWVFQKNYVVNCVSVACKITAVVINWPLLTLKWCLSCISACLQAKNSCCKLCLYWFQKYCIYNQPPLTLNWCFSSISACFQPNNRCCKLRQCCFQKYCNGHGSASSNLKMMFLIAILIFHSLTNVFNVQVCNLFCVHNDLTTAVKRH